MTEERHEAPVDPAARRESPWWGVHAARYLYALPFAEGRRTLDVACGSGYGLPLLAGRAVRVVGVDADESAARSARRWARDVNAQVLVSDGCRLPFADATWQCVTSFETIEHLRDRAAFVRELRRVTTGDATCVFSTPNANYTQPIDGRPRNPFHVHEYTPVEFISELRAHFASVTLVGQVLNPRFTISPFWDDQQRLPRTVRAQSRLLAWRVLNRMPAAVRDGVSRALWGHALIPGEGDYQFSGEAVERAPVLVAVCRGVAA